MQENHRHAEKQPNKLLGVLERTKAFVTQGDEPVTVRPGKIHAELEKAGTDPDFIRFMISSREDLDGEYYGRTFGGEDRDSFILCLSCPDISWLKSNFLISHVSLD